MTTIVLDASVAIAWAYEDETSDYTDRVLVALKGGEALVPAIWPPEICNAVLCAERRGRFPKAGIIAFLDLLRDARPIVDCTPVETLFTAALPLAREHNLSVYDASYLELAARRQAQLATVDQRLKKAAKRAGVALFE